MNLQEFLQYRTHCVCCGKQLVAKINSSREITVNNNVSEFEVQLKAIKRGHKSYLAKFTILNATNEFGITFKELKKGEPFLSYVPFHITNRLKEYLDNNKCYISVNCGCKSYNYISNRFELNYKDGVMPDISIHEENIFELWVKNTQKMWLKNDYNKKETSLYPLSSTRYSSSPVASSEATKLPIIKFTTLKDTANRINKLLVFS
jgi:hypothetical protein